MKTGLKRLCTLLLALCLLFTLVPAALADEEDEDEEDLSAFALGLGAEDPEDGGGQDRSTGFDVPQVLVFFYEREVEMKTGDECTVSASVTDAIEGATYEWYCSNESVVSIRGTKNAVKLTATGTGTAEIRLHVTNRIGETEKDDQDSFTVSVTAPASPIQISGGGNVVADEGETRTLTASVTGGSGTYNYVWDGDDGLHVSNLGNGLAEVYAGKSGDVTLTVTDNADHTNYATATWRFTVNEKPELEPPVITDKTRGAIDLGAGGTATLSIMVSGGSGNFQYNWRNDNPNVISLQENGNTVTIHAASTLLPGSNTAQISVSVYDLETGLTSNTEYCNVAVTGGEASFDTSASASAGVTLGMNDVARAIAQHYTQTFGTGLNYSANVQFESAGSNVGVLRLQDDTAVIAGRNYAYATFQDMGFYPITSGTFSTRYQITDGGNTIRGTITIYVSGGVSVTDATLTPASMSMAVFSSQYLNLSVAPANASFTVKWETANSSIAQVNGSGSTVTVRSAGKIGTTTVTAVITDANGNTLRRSCSVTVYDNYIDPDVYYDPTLTIMLGSDYYGTKLSDAMASKFRSAFGVNLAEGDIIIFPSLGSSTLGTLRLRDGSAVVAKREYTFRDWIDMYFTPTAAGTYSMEYQLHRSKGGNLLRGTIKIIIQSASINVTMNPTSLQMAPYSSQFVSLSIAPNSAYYHVSWTTSDSRVATVSGSNNGATVTSVGYGTATVTAVVTDYTGVEIRRSCTVVVSSGASGAFNPTVATTLGIPYVGTGTSSAMRSQFQAVHGIALADNAIIRFSSTGNNEVGVMRLADGSMIRPNTDYTLAQYVAMYTQPVSAGTYSVPYTLSYAGRSLSGTIGVIVNSASISTNLTLTSNAAYWFSDPISGSTGGAIFADSIRNAVGSNWSYIRFGSTADATGTLYLDRNYTGLSQSTNVTAAALGQLFFVPGTQTGTFNAPYTVYTATGAVVGTGTLSIARQGISFADVSEYAYYAPAVSWAVNRGVTSGTSATTFSPDTPVTRGQAVTFLWRAAGQPKSVVTVNPFYDVAQGSYYYDAVLWAVQQGITNGTSDVTFSPDAPVNRDQFLTFLCRSSGGYAGGADWSNLAVGWANARGLLTGIPGDFIAASVCPRSDVVYYLWKNQNSGS